MWIKSILIVDECQNIQFTCQTCHYKNEQRMEDKCRVNSEMPYILNMHQWAIIFFLFWFLCGFPSTLAYSSICLPTPSPPQSSPMICLMGIFLLDPCAESSCDIGQFPRNYHQTTQKHRVQESMKNLHVIVELRHNLLMKTAFKIYINNLVWHALAQIYSNFKPP